MISCNKEDVIKKRNKITEGKIMFKNFQKEKFSLRKYKDGRTDSKLIGAITILGIAMLAGGGTASARWEK